MNEYYKQFNDVWLRIDSIMYLRENHIRICIRNEYIQVQYWDKELSINVLCESLNGTFCQYWNPSFLSVYLDYYSKNDFENFKKAIDEINLLR